MIRWRNTNSPILHLDSSGRREMSVDSSPFIRLVPFSLTNLSYPEQRQTEGMIHGDQTPETPGTQEGKGHAKRGEAPWRPPTRANVSMN